MIPRSAAGARLPSGRNLAAELGVGTMTLYRDYRRNQDRLNALADTALRAVIPPDGRGP